MRNSGCEKGERMRKEENKERKATENLNKKKSEAEGCF
jgi:hypothetical protein